MTDIYLKAPTIEDFYNELGKPFVKEVEYDNDGVLATKKIFTTEVTHACSYVGVIVDEAGIYDEEGNEVSPAVEAVEAQPEETVTDIFENSEDAPEGATEVTQRGVRYSELLAFIISAI